MRTFFHFAFARLQVVNYLVSLVLLLSPRLCLSQNFPHGQAHAHNDYEHPHPLFDALKNGFTSVEADVHLRKGDLSVGHNSVTDQSPRLRRLYLAPLDSLLRSGSLPSGFCLMIDIKTDAEETYQALKEDLKKYPALICTTKPCALKIVLSGNRPLKTMVGEGFRGIALDGRPGDLGQGFDKEMMPVISDHYKNWSSWRGEKPPRSNELSRIQTLANRVHAEGKKLRLWAIPDNEVTWEALLLAGVDYINTDHLEELNAFLTNRGR